MRSVRLPWRAGLVAVFSALLLAATGTAAHASGGWGIQDGFEDNPAARWNLESYGDSFAGFSIDPTFAHSGNNYVELDATTDFSAVGRTVTVPVGAGIDCSLSVFGRDVAPAEIALEVIDPATWTYLAVDHITLPPGGYQQVFGSVFTPNPGDVFIRISLIAGSSGNTSVVLVDDVQFGCIRI